MGKRSIVSADKDPDGFGARHAIRDWRSDEISKIQSTLAEKARVVRLELESDLSRLGRIDLLRSEASLFGKRVEARVKPAFEETAQTLLEQAGRDLHTVAAAVEAGEACDAEPAGFAALLAPVRAATDVAIPAFGALGVGLGLYIVFALAISTVTSFLVLRTTNVDEPRLLLGLGLVVISAYVLLSAPSRVLQRKRDRLLARYDAFVEREISPSDGGPHSTALEPRLIAAIKNRAAELEAALPDA